MFGDGLSRPVCWLSPGVSVTVTCGRSLREHISLPAHPLWGSAGELVAGSRAGEKQLVFVPKSGRKNLLSMQERALGSTSTRAAFKHLKGITVVPGALFLPASAA